MVASARSLTYPPVSPPGYVPLPLAVEMLGEATIEDWAAGDNGVCPTAEPGPKPQAQNFGGAAPPRSIVSAPRAGFPPDRWQERLATWEAAKERRDVTLRAFARATQARQKILAALVSGDLRFWYLIEGSGCIEGAPKAWLRADALDRVQSGQAVFTSDSGQQWSLLTYVLKAEVERLGLPAAVGATWMPSPGETGKAWAARPDVRREVERRLALAHQGVSAQKAGAALDGIWVKEAGRSPMKPNVFAQYWKEGNSGGCGPVTVAS